jgi:hypothetical protein
MMNFAGKEEISKKNKIFEILNSQKQSFWDTKSETLLIFLKKIKE